MTAVIFRLSLMLPLLAIGGALSSAAEQMHNVSEEAPTNLNVATATIAGHTLRIPTAYFSNLGGLPQLSNYIRLRLELPCLTPLSGPDPAISGKGWGSTLAMQISTFSISHHLFGKQLIAAHIGNNNVSSVSNPDLAEATKIATDQGFRYVADNLVSRDVFAHGPEADEFVLVCSRKRDAPSPSCSNEFGISGGLLIGYQFGRNWVDPDLGFSLILDQRIRALVDQFLSDGPAQSSQPRGVCK